MNNNGSYLEWKFITLDCTSEDETFRSSKMDTTRTSTDEPKSFPLSSNTSSPLESGTGSTPSSFSKILKVEIVKPLKETKPKDTDSFASNTIKRYSRFRAKQDKKERSKSKPKSVDSHHLYANLSYAIDKKTLVQRWIDTNPNTLPMFTDKEHCEDHSCEISPLSKAKELKKYLPVSTPPMHLPTQSPVLVRDDDDVPLELRCPVCLDLYQKPLFLPCGHTYCKNCIEQVVDSSDKESKKRKRFICPTCRNIIKYGDEGIEALPKNLNLEVAVARYETGQAVKAPLCQSHIKFRQEKTIWCEECNCCICPLCVIDGSHKGHEVAPLNVMTKFQKVRKNLQKTKQVLANRVDDLQTSLHQMNKNRMDLDTKCAAMKSKIDKECEAMIALIQKQHQDMYKQMEQAIKKKHKRKQRQITTITDDIDRTTSMLDEIQSILNTEKPAHFLEKVKKSKIMAPEYEQGKLGELPGLILPKIAT